MALLFNGTNAVNGFDSLGHYIRTEAIVGGCTAYSKITVGGCSANFTHQTLSEAGDTTSPAQPGTLHPPHPPHPPQTNAANAANTADSVADGTVRPRPSRRSPSLINAARAFRRATSS